MIHYQTTIPKKRFPENRLCFFDESSLLLDIETTGLSAEKNHIYCIGCSYLSGNDAVISLLFAENRQQEAEILAQFRDIVQPFSKIITFNGTTFDIPFLKKKFAVHGLADPFGDRDCPDLYRETLSLKALLRLENYKQKTIERFLGIRREDLYSGGELISVYHTYEKTSAPDTLRILLRHNFEDVKGMYDLLPLHSYRVFLDGGFGIRRIDTEQERETGSLFLNFFLRPDNPFPQSLRLLSEDGTIALTGDSALIQLPVRHGTLKHFFTDYQNYYYLPEEDTAVHKSVGIFVDASHRKKATAKNCFVKKDCAFLRISASCADNVLRQDFTDRRTYLDLTEYLSLRQERFPAIGTDQYPRFRPFLELFLKNI